MSFENLTKPINSSSSFQIFSESPNFIIIIHCIRYSKASFLLCTHGPTTFFSHWNVGINDFLRNLRRIFIEKRLRTCVNFKIKKSLFLILHLLHIVRVNIISIVWIYEYSNRPWVIWENWHRLLKNKNKKLM